MINKVKYYLIGVAVLFLIGAVVTVNIQKNKIKLLNSENERLSGNNYQLFTNVRNQEQLFLREKELSKVLIQQRDSLSRTLRIAPKQVISIKYETQTIHDTVNKMVFVEKVAQNFWHISDNDKCWTWKGNAILNDDSLNIVRTSFDYKNKVTETYYKKAPHLWFIRLGKWKYYTDKKPECGELVTQEFHFIGK